MHKLIIIIKVCTIASGSAAYLCWLVSEACQTSTSACVASQVVFEWLHLDRGRQLAGIATLTFAIDLVPFCLVFHR